MFQEKVGFIGLGNMGLPMAKNLEKAGVPLYVYNRTPQKAADFEQNSTVVSSIADLVAATSIIFTMLTDDKAVQSVYQSILTLEVQGKLFVDLSTIAPLVSQSIATDLKAKGAGFIDAPVAGSTGPARDATLIIMVGGEKQQVERARPLLSLMGKAVKHLGDNGKGLATKIAVNYFLATLYAGLAETMVFADQVDVGRQELLEIINESASGSGATKIKTPLLTRQQYPAQFQLDLMVKDILLAKDAGADFSIGGATLATFLKAQQEGLGKEDVISVINAVE